MHVLILGAAGMIGKKLADTLAQSESLAAKTVTELTLIDIILPAAPKGFGGKVTCLMHDMTQYETARKVAKMRADVIYHLAAVVSGEAERDFEKGYSVNMNSSHNLFEAIRLEGDAAPYRPKVIFTSSLAVYGAPLPDPIPDDFILAPQSSYGTQKAICELLLDDYSRKGFIDGVGIRLPTIVIRPGKPNAAASSFFSSILREPLAGKPASLPVPDSFRHWFASPRAAIGLLVHAAEIDTSKLGSRRTFNVPGVAASVADQLAALERAIGPEAVGLVKHEPDAAISEIISGWPQSFAPERAIALGFVADTSMDEIISVYLDEQGQVN